MKILKNLQDIIVIQMYEIVKIQMHFQSNYFIYKLKNYKCVHLGTIFKNIYFFIWTKYGGKNG